MVVDTRYVLGLAVAIVLGWFALGIIYNLRRGEALIRWMRGGLPKIGERSTFRWMGSSVAEMVIEQARAPFRRLITLVVLMPRDTPWMWAWALANGRRDTLIFRSELRSAPGASLELVDPKAWTGRMAAADVLPEGWESQPYSPPLTATSTGPAGERSGVIATRAFQLLAPRGSLGAAERALPNYLPLLERLSPRYIRLSLRRDPPSLEIHLPFPDPRQTDVGAYFDTLRELARTVTA